MIIVRTRLAAALLTTGLLLVGCGTTDAAPSTSTQSSTSSASAPSPTAPASSAEPSDETDHVMTATRTFVSAALTLGYPDKSTSDYEERVGPLMTSKGFSALRSDLAVGDTLQKLKTQYGARSRTTPHPLSKVTVKALSTESATTGLTFENQLQQRTDDGWKTLKKSSEQTVEVSLVRDGDDWLVDAVK